MANHGYCFDNVFVALVRAGEQSGQMTEVLDELSENLKWQDEMAGQAKKAMIYPAIVFVVIIAVIFVLMTVLVPQLAATFKTLVPKLPRETEVLIFLSNIFVRWWYLLLGIPAALIAAGWFFGRTNERAQRAIDELGLKLPVLGRDPPEDHPRALLDLLRDALQGRASACSTASRSARRSWATA